MPISLVLCGKLLMSAAISGCSQCCVHTLTATQLDIFFRAWQPQSQGHWAIPLLILGSWTQVSLRASGVQSPPGTWKIHACFTMQNVHRSGQRLITPTISTFANTVPTHHTTSAQLSSLQEHVQRLEKDFQKANEQTCAAVEGLGALQDMGLDLQEVRWDL